MERSVSLILGILVRYFLGGFGILNFSLFIAYNFNNVINIDNQLSQMHR